MRILYTLFFVVLCQISSAKQLALSFDDGLNPHDNPNAEQINHAILATLAQHKIHAIVFPALNKTGTEAGLTFIQDWGEQGHRIGNHSAEHLNLNSNDVSLPRYIQGMQQAHDVLRPLPNFVPRYRFPFLKEGDTVVKRDGVRQWLKSQHYQSGAVSIDASDWYYNQLFLKYQAANDFTSLAKLKQAYIAHLLDRAYYYDALARQTLGRSPKHVLLLHVRAINAAWLNDVIEAFEQQDWQFIDSDTAYQDPLYRIELNTLPTGESILWSIAQLYGLKDLRYPAEDAPYEQQNLANFGLRD